MKRLTFTMAAICLAAGPVVAQSKPDSGADGNKVETDAGAAAIIADCSARKFETSIEITENGQPRKSKVKLCGKQGQTDAQWANTLRDAASKVEANDKMPQAAKDQLIAALNAEIAKLGPKSAPTAVLSVVATPSPKAAAKPHLKIKCLLPGDKGTGSNCLSLNRTTTLSIRADEAVAGKVGLRFLRRGDVRGVISLAQMRQGQVVRSRLPAELCAGVASSQVQIQVVSSNQVAETLGPFKLTC